MGMLYCEKAQEPSVKYTEEKAAQKPPSQTSYLILIYSQTFSHCILGGRNPVEVMKACPATHLNKFMDGGEPLLEIR